MARSLTQAEFKKLFDELVTATRKEARAKGPVDLTKILTKHGIKMDLPKQIANQVMPAMTVPTKTTAAMRRNACGACPACGLCIVCGALNAGTPGAFAASIWNIVD